MNEPTHPSPARRRVPSALPLIMVLAALVLSGQAYAGGFWLESRDGREVEVTDISFDGEKIKARRVADGRYVRIPPAALTPQSWEALNEAMTDRMRVGLDVRSAATTRRQTTHWSTSYGSSETTTTSIRKFDVRVTSTSYFRKPCRVVSYWITGDTATAEAHDVMVSRDEPFEVVAGGAASRYQLTLVAIGEYYSSGPSTDTDVVVVVEHDDGTICELYATRKSAEDLIRAEYAQD